MSNRRILIVLALLLMLGLLAACGGGAQPTPTSPPQATEAPAQPPAGFVCDDPIGCVDIGPDEPIRIGYALVISGPNETLGVDSRRGIEIAIDDRPEVLGHK
ncbi:MAG: branched-chain amino acid ABC transporter substrate-binding protein, partial [Chloroflexi bacterium]